MRRRTHPVHPSATITTGLRATAERQPIAERQPVAERCLTDGRRPTAPARSATGPCAAHGSALTHRVRSARRAASDAGMATAEYAVATLAAVGFAGVLVVVLKGGEVKSLLTGIIRQALGG